MSQTANLTLKDINPSLQDFNMMSGVVDKAGCLRALRRSRTLSERGVKRDHT